MALTRKQEQFCTGCIELDSASDAYRNAYSTEKMTDKQIWEESSKLQKNPKVAQRLKELKEEHRVRHNITVDDLLKELEEARTCALTCETPQSSAAVGATMGKAKLLGLDKQIIDHTSTDGTMTPKATVIAKDVQDVLDKL